MSPTAETLAHDLLLLSKEERMEVFFRLAESLPTSSAQIAESALREKDWENGNITPLSQEDFDQKSESLRSRFQSGSE